MTDLATLLRRHRQKSGLTQKQLSERIHFHHSVISRTENPRSAYLPSRDYLDIFAAQLGLSDAEKDSLLDALSAAGRDPQPGPVTQVRNPGPRVVRVHLGVALLVVAALAWGPIQRTWQTFQNTKEYAQAEAGEVLYATDFESGDLGDWRNLNEGDWGLLPYGDGLALGVHDLPPDMIPHLYLLPSEYWTNYAVEMEARFFSGQFEQIYVVVRNAQVPNCSGYQVGGNRDGISIFRFETVGDECQGEYLAVNDKIPLASGIRRTIRVEADGNVIRLVMAGRVVLSAIDDTYPSGGLAFLAYEVRSAYFDNIRVFKLP